MNYWSIERSPTSIAKLGEVRAIHGWDVLDVGETLWLRYSGSAESDVDWRGWPGVEQWTPTADDRLCRTGRRIPSADLPKGDWYPLSGWLKVIRPTSIWPGRLDARIPLRLVRAKEQRPVQMLRATWIDWYRYAESAPLVRLQPLSFTADVQGCSLIQGTPLPPIRGEALTLEEGILCPAGWAFYPPVDATTIRQALATETRDARDLFLWDRSRSGFFRVPASSFVTATRTAVRATHAHLASLESTSAGSLAKEGQAT